MAWETRNGRGRYYTRSVRIDGRVRRQYFGCGKRGEEAARADAERRALRHAERAARGALEAELDAAELPLLEFIDGVDLLTRARLLAAGFHQHKRGEWRRRRARRQTQR